MKIKETTPFLKRSQEFLSCLGNGKTIYQIEEEESLEEGEKE